MPDLPENTLPNRGSHNFRIADQPGTTLFVDAIAFMGDQSEGFLDSYEWDTLGKCFSVRIGRGSI